MFGLSWLQRWCCSCPSWWWLQALSNFLIELATTNRILRKICWLVSSEPELNKQKLQMKFYLICKVEYSHKLSEFLGLNFWVELSFINVIKMNIIGNPWSVDSCSQNQTFILKKCWLPFTVLTIPPKDQWILCATCLLQRSGCNQWKTGSSL